MRRIIVTNDRVDLRTFIFPFKFTGKIDKLTFNLGKE
jgi:hypothetical protein